jgi:hypothetical protein
MTATTTVRAMLGVALLSLIPATRAAADPKHWHEDSKHGQKHHDESCYFRREDARVIREYYEPRYRSLPPGIAKKYYRTGHLPPGWEKKMEPLPVVVERELMPLPPGYRRGYIDGAVVVYSPATRVMIDVMALF